MRWALLLLLLLLTAACTRSETASRPPWLSACELAGVHRTALCGRFDVYEDRRAGAGRRIGLNVAVIPATSRAEPDPIVFFAGGPGDDAVDAGPFVVGMLGDPRSRDIVLIDQRGTGGSGVLTCPLYSGTGIARFTGAFMPLDAVRECRDRLSRTADLRHYTSSIAVDDVAEVLTALGYDRVNLFGGSYGTRMAQVFLRQHPKRVRSVILQGVTTMRDRIPIGFARSAQRAFDRLLAECEATPDCRAVFPRLRSDAATVFDRARRGSIDVVVTDPSTDADASVAMPGDMVGEVVRWMMYSPRAARRVPALLHRAATGDWRPLAEAAIRERRAIMAPNSMGLYLSVTCAEDLPGSDADAAKRLAEGTYLGDYRYREQRAACEEWVAGAVPQDFHTDVVSDVPALLVSGALDPVTPPESGEAVAARLENSLHLVVPFGAHGTGGLQDNGCLARLLREFVERGTVAGLDTACVAQIRPPALER
ncbi:MAG TPA: alpha/beta fold hydrolase [Vicinamibacterales bacterium]|jgi:pimeloyl-ACP methyl ester carboxylesterase|nr:alpha/beta fold hydrolase [Vicinamibacterales bacterium]